MKISSDDRGVALTSWLEKAHELRTRLFEAEVELLVFLLDGETLVDWRGAWKSYEAFLVDHRLCDAARYASFRNAMRTVTKADALKVGVDGAIRAASVKTAPKREELLVELKHFAADTGHPPSPQFVRTTAQRIAPEARPGAHTQAALARDKLREENDALRRQVAQLKSENARLTAELAKIRGEKPAGKRSVGASART